MKKHTGKQVRATDFDYTFVSPNEIETKLM